MPASLAVHSFNEADALRRLILSSLHATPAFDEWVVLDHRSGDHTQEVLDQLEPVLAAYGVRLRRLFESRDLSREVTFASVRARTIHAAANPVVALMDSDFILSSGFARLLATSTRDLTDRRGRLHAVHYPVPVVWDRLCTNDDGRITTHGRVWRHTPKARILHAPSVTYEQTGGDGKWEALVLTNPSRPQHARVPNDGSILVSSNVKPPERIALRETMTMFMQDVQGGQRDGDWLTEYGKGGLTVMPAYKFDRNADLTRHHLNLAGLRL